MYEQGRYWGRVMRAELGETKNGHPQVVIRFSVQGKIDVSNPSAALLPCEMYERTIYRAITTEKGAAWAVKDLRTLGYQKDGFTFLHPEHPHYESLEGVEFECECRHEVYEGETREKWFVYDPAGGAQVKPLDKAAARKLDAMFGKCFKEAPPIKESVKESPAVLAKAGGERQDKTDDIPF